MSVDLSVRKIEQQICGLYGATEKNNGVDCNGNGCKDNEKNDDDPVDALAHQVGELKGDRVESESRTGVPDDQINKEENIQAVEKETEEKLVKIMKDRDLEENKRELINHEELSSAVAEAQESQDTSVDVAESELNRSSIDEEMVEEESKFNSSFDIKENEDSQAVVSNVVHNDLDLDQLRDPAELNHTEDVAEYEPNQSSNDDEKVENRKFDSEDCQILVSNGLNNSLDLDQEMKPKELMDDDDFTKSKPNQSSNDGEKVELEEKSKLDSSILVEENKDSQPVVINGSHNNLDLNQEKEPSELIYDLPLEGNREASEDSFKQNLETAPCPVVADEKLEAESAEGLVSDGNGFPAGRAQDTVSETQVVDSLVDAEQNMSDSSSENVELLEAGKNFPIAADNVILGDAANHILKDTVQSEVLAANGLDIHEKGGLLASQESASQTVLVNDFVHASQMITEHNHTLEIGMEVSSHEVAPVKSCESFPISPSSGDMVAQPALRIEDSLSVEDTKWCDIVRKETEFDNVHANDDGSDDSHSVDVAKVEAGVGNGAVVDYTTQSCPANDVKPDIGNGSHSIESEEKVSTFSSGDVDADSEVREAMTGDASRASVSVDSQGGKTFGHDSTENENRMPKPEVKTESVVENTSTAPGEEIVNGDGLVSQCEYLNDPVVIIENGDQFIDRAGDKKTCSEDEGFDEVSKDETPKSTLEDTAIEQNVATEVGKGPFCITKFPRYDENNGEKVEHTKFQVEKKNKSWHAIQPEIQMKKVWDQKNRIAKTKKHAKPAPLENGSPIVSGRDQNEDPKQEENKRNKEEEELVRKAEELRKEKEAAMLKEQGRLEENAKAKEAELERKEKEASMFKEKRRLEEKAKAKEAELARKAEELRKEKEASMFKEQRRLEEKAKAKGAELARKAEELRKEKIASMLKEQRRLKEKAKAKEAELARKAEELRKEKEAEKRRLEEKAKAKEAELARKAEELRKAKETEQRRLEEKAKAKEAMERKKRMADKALARAALRAQREAEQKEKEREKKARKKEKRRAAAEDTKDIHEIESAPSSENPIETKQPVNVTKKPQKPSQFAKQTKANSMPPPLRNRSKGKRQRWMWPLLSLLLVIAFAFMGNSSFFDFGLQRSGI